MATSECNVSPCPIDCADDEWDEWSTCTASCNNGTQARSRILTSVAQFGGQPCADDSTEQSRDCNAHACKGYYHHQDEYKACEAGTFQADSTPGMIMPTSCSLCEVGQHQSEPGADACVKCLAGSYQPERGRGSCNECAAGKFQGNEESDRCVRCAVGRSNNNTGSDDISACAACPAGQFQAGAGARLCADCGLGHFANNTARQIACEECPGGKYADTTTNVECTACAAGKRGLNTTAKTAMTHCETCPTGQFQEEDGSTLCVNCESGKFTSAQHDRSACESCSSFDTVADALRFHWTQNEAGWSTCVKHPLDCKRGAWAPQAFDSCTQSCYNGELYGTYQRTASPVYPEWGGGVGCADMVETNNVDSYIQWTGHSWINQERCNTHRCPVDCVVSEWTDFSSCSKSCEGGNTTKTRAIVAPEYGGVPCPEHSVTKPCNEQKCAVAECHSKQMTCSFIQRTVNDSGTMVNDFVTVMNQSKFDHYLHDSIGYKCAGKSGACKCTCNDHPIACFEKNMVLANTDTMLGNIYKNSTMRRCSSMCKHHEHCSGWVFNSEDTCALKNGTNPVYANNTGSITTYAGLKAAGTDGCLAPAPKKCAIHQVRTIHEYHHQDAEFCEACPQGRFLHYNYHHETTCSEIEQMPYTYDNVTSTHTPLTGTPWKTAHRWFNDKQFTSP
jgi:hypothetical protein